MDQGEAQPEGTEALNLMRVSFDEALNMVASGKITDALSVIAIQSYALAQRQGQTSAVAARQK